MKNFTTVLILLLSSFFAQEIKAQCGTGVSAVLNTQTDVNNFIANNCTNYLGSIIILDNNDMIDNITDLTPLSTLTAVGGMLLIRNNFSLTSLNGLQSLVSVNGASGLLILNNTILTDISNLSSLTTIGKNLTIQTNNIASLTGLDNLTSVGGDLIISNNDLLTDLTSLSNLTSINGYLSITQNDLLTSLSGLGNIDHTTISASNPVIDDIIITDNPLLNECEVTSICDAINTGAVTINIMNNATSCVSSAAILTACQALPVEWLNQVTARAKKNNIEISFATATQINNSHFEIEHSRDGSNYHRIGKIEGEGNTFLETHYNFLDEHPSLGNNYYRVKQVDFDGKFEYSNIASAHFKVNEIKIFPNPINAQINITAESDIETVSIIDMMGKTVKTVVAPNQAIDVSTLAKGIYFLQIQAGNTLLSKKIIKE